MCDKYQPVLSLGLTEDGKFCQYNQSSANKMLPFFPKEECRLWGDNYIKWSEELKVNCTELSILPIPVVVLINWFINSQEVADLKFKSLQCA